MSAGMGLAVSVGMGMGMGAVDWALTPPMHSPKVVVTNAVRVALKTLLKFMIQSPINKVNDYQQLKFDSDNFFYATMSGIRPMLGRTD